MNRKRCLLFRVIAIIGILAILPLCHAFAAEVTITDATDGALKFAQSASAVSGTTPKGATISVSGTTSVPEAVVTIMVVRDGLSENAGKDEILAATIYANVLISDASGAFSLSFPLSPVAPDGIYAVKVNVEGATTEAAARFFRTGEVTGLYGDVDGNGGVDELDAMWIMRHCIGLDTPANCNWTAADVDGNGGVDELDAMWIMRYCIGLPIGDAMVGKPL